MRILRLDLRHGQGTVDLHPFISVVQGLGPHQADELVSAIRGLVRGSEIGLGGLIESGGELMELRGDGTDQVGPLTTEDIFLQLDDESSGDPVVLRAELDQLHRRAMIDAVQLEEARADLSSGAAARVQRLHAALAAFDGDDSGELRRLDAVKTALAALEGVEPVLREMPVDVREILGEWEAFEAERDKAQPQLDALNRNVQSLLLEREAAQGAVVEAQAHARPITLSPEEDNRVEELSERKKLSPDEEAEIAALLAKVGQATFVGYAMYRMAPQPSADAVAAVDAARLRVEQIEAKLAEAREELQNGPVPQSLNAILEGVKETARRHLGPMLPTDLGAALRKQVIERENPVWMERLRDLFDEMVAQQIAVPDDLDPNDLPDFARSWVAKTEAPGEAELGPSRAELLGELASAEKQLERHARSMSRIERLEATAHESAERVVEVRRRLESADAPMGTSGERAIAVLRPLADRVRVEAGSSVPLIVQGEFADLDAAAVSELLDELEVLAQDLQLVILTNRAEALEWTASVGLRRALGSTLTATAG